MLKDYILHEDMVGGHQLEVEVEAPVQKKSARRLRRGARRRVRVPQ